MSNPFNTTLDWALRGKYARVHTDTGVFEGWVDRVHHNRGSVVLHDATNTTTEESLGSVFIRVCEVIEVLTPKKRIEFISLEDLSPYPEYDIDFRPKDEIVRQCYRNQFPGSFPVVRENGTIINGHKRVAAAEIAGLEQLPVEMISVTDQQAADLFRVAHRDSDNDEEVDRTTTDSEDTTDETDTAEPGSAASGDSQKTDQDDDEGSGVVFGYDH